MPVGDDSFDAAMYRTGCNSFMEITDPDILTGFCRKAAQNESGEYAYIVSKDNIPVKLVYEPDFIPTISFKNGSSITVLDGNSDIEDDVADEISQADLDAILNGTYGE